MPKRITQTNEIQSGDNSGIVFSGDEKASYSQDFTLEEFEGRDLITLDAANELISGNDPIPTISVWEEGETAMLDDYRTHQIGDIEYLFRSTVDDNVSEPTLSETSGAWIQTDKYGFVGSWSDFASYNTGDWVTGDANTKVYESKVDANLDNEPSGGVSDVNWKYIGEYKGFYFAGTFNQGDIVILASESNRLYVSNIPDNEQPITDIVIASTWKVIGAPGGGSSGTPTSGTLLSSDSPLVITWDTDLVPDDEEGRTYLEKHGPLEKVSIQVTMPDPANDGDNTFFPSWRFDEATKNILTIDNQGQKLYYVIGFGADGSSGGGGTGDLTNANFIDSEEPAGDIDGTNVTYTLAFTPVAGSVKLYLNGLRQRSGSGNDYTIAGDTITMASAPVTGNVLIADYRK